MSTRAPADGSAGLRVGLLTTSYPASPGDTAGLFVQGFAETLAGRGHDVRVIAPALDSPPARNHAPYPAAAAHTARVGDGRGSVQVQRLRYAYPSALQRTFHRAGAPENLRADPLAALGALTYPLVLAAHVATLRHRLDVVVSHWAVPSGLVATLPAVGLRRGRPPRRVVVTHGADLHLLERMPLGAALARRIASASDALTFVSGTHQRRFEALVGGSVPHGSVLAMGVPALPARSAESRERARHALGVRGPVVLTLGRLVPIKGLDVLIEALRDMPELTLVLAGEGPARASLLQQATRCGVRVRFPGVVVGAEKTAWLHAADVFALPSRRLVSGREEGTPTALLEAMQVGLAVVATDTGGVGELLLGGLRGALVPPEDAGALRGALSDVLRAPARARETAERAREVAQAQTWDRLAPRLDALVRGA